GLFTESLDRQVGAFTRVMHLSKANQTYHFGGQVRIAGSHRGVGRQARWEESREADRLTSDLIDYLIANRGPIVRAREIVHVALKETAKLEEVIASHP